MKYHKDGALPDGDEIFVFGSNLAGRHGMGAANAALKRYGAVYGKGIGLHGQSYGIPTKDENLKVIPIDEVAIYIRDFIEFSKSNPDKQFFVTAIGCGLAGYKPEQIAPLFRGVGDNVSLPDVFKEFFDEK